MKNLVKLKNWTLALLVVLSGLFSNTASGQAFTNGSCEGPGGLALAPISWTMVSGSTDMLTVPPGIVGFTFTEAATLSSDGGMFVESYCEIGGYTERFQQTVVGFTIGETYTITYEESNFGSCLSGYCPTNAAEWLVFVSGLPVMTSGNVLAPAPGWLNACLTFTATATSHTIGFEGGFIGGGDSGATILIDNIQLSVGGIDGTGFDYANLFLCTGDPIEPPVMGGAITGGFTATPAGLVLDPVTGEIDPAASDVGVYDVTYSPGGCFADITVTVEIIDGVDATFEYDPSIFCSGGVDPFPNFDVDGDGVEEGGAGDFTAAPAGLVIDPVTGEIDLDASVTGTYTITNTIVDIGCGGDVQTFDITILSVSSADFEYSAITYCHDEPNQLPSFDVDGDGVDDGTPGTFTSTAGLVIDPITGEVDIAASTPGTYTVTSTIVSVECGDDVHTTDITIEALPVMDPMADEDVCNGLPLTIPAFSASGVAPTYTWTNVTGTNVGFGLAGAGNIPTFAGLNLSGATVTVIVEVFATTASGCVGAPTTFEVTIHPTPVVSFSIDDYQICAPQAVTFHNTSTPTGVNCHWDFGDGSTGDACDLVSHNYSAGIFDVTLTVESSDGCSASITYYDYIELVQPPVADFTVDKYVTDLYDTKFQFTNQSIDASTYLWDFDDSSPTSNDINPTHIYPQVPATYNVWLWAYGSDPVCYDSTYVQVVVNDVILYFIPNTFTPDGDDFNETFQPVFTSGIDIYDFHMIIYNRWGEKVFESFNPAAGWNGAYGDGGMVQDGTYVWQIEFLETMSDKRHKDEGTVTILK
ncbi:MAG: PKD domain-containing protein [Crocinitomix sp.]|nr:PKD domain-containing protein [Crocinitomix sp.]